MNEETGKQSDETETDRMSDKHTKVKKPNKYTNTWTDNHKNIKNCQTDKQTEKSIEERM